MISHRSQFDPDIEAIDGSISHFSPIFHAAAKFPMESRARDHSRFADSIIDFEAEDSGEF